MQSEIQATTFQGLLLTMQQYWAQQDCVIQQPYDMEMGAGTFHPATFLRALGPEPWRAAYVQPVRRPGDGRYGENPNRLQHYYQFQVLLKPSPDDMQERYLDSLRWLGFDLLQHDVRFVEDNWESPTLGAWGLGWEVWLDGMEISQFTYFQQVGGLPCQPVSGELTYGLERIAMIIQDVDDVFDLVWTRRAAAPLRYGDLYRQNEREMSQYNFDVADVAGLRHSFDALESECERLLEAKLPLPACEQVIRASHVFNMLDARNAISVQARQGYMLRVRALAKRVAEAWQEGRAALHFPLLNPGAPKASPEDTSRGRSRPAAD